MDVLIGGLGGLPSGPALIPIGVEENITVEIIIVFFNISLGQKRHLDNVRRCHFGEELVVELPLTFDNDLFTVGDLVTKFLKNDCKNTIIKITLLLIS